MKTRETKERDLAALTESLQNSKSAMVMSFSKLTVTKDQEFRRTLREAGASYQVVKNTLARIAVKGTQFEDATGHFKGVTAIAWTENDPVVLSKTISKFIKDNADIYTFKAGVLDGQLLDLQQLTTIANLPSKEELISKLLYVLNSPAQRIVTVINAVPRDLAVVIKQIGENKPADAAAPAAAEAKTEEPAPVEAAPAEAEATADAPAAEDVPAVEAAPAEEAAAVEAAPAEETPVEAAQAEEAPAEDAPVEAAAEPADEVDATSTEAESEATEAAPDDAGEDVLEIAPEGEPSDKAE